MYPIHDETAYPGDAVMSVSALNRVARQALEARFPLLWVVGEVSNLRRPASGHLYFSLKDEGAQVNCAMFRGRAQGAPFRLQDGMRIEARALVTLFEPRGDFQLNVEAVRAAGIGSLYEAFLRLRARLEQEGLFDDARRRALPRYPRRIAVVTSLQAAALRDVLAALSRRAPHLPVLICAAPVQGEGAAERVAEAIRQAASQPECDAVLVVRGGGSIEDLWAFNEERVARAIATSPVPVVTGVGHESDTTIADLVADRRAATPTAAAELVSAGYFEARMRLSQLDVALRSAALRALEQRMQRADGLARRLRHPGERLARLGAETAHLATRLAAALRRAHAQRRIACDPLRSRLLAARPDIPVRRLHADTLGERLHRAWTANLASRQAHVDAVASHLDHLNPSAVLARGYSIVRGASGTILTSGAQAAIGETLDITFAQGGARARVLAQFESTADVASGIDPD